MFIHLFTIRQRIFEPIELDSLLIVDNTDPLVMLDQDTYVAALELSHIPDGVKRKRETLSAYITTSAWRSRYNSDIYPEILRLDVEVEINMESIECHLNHLPQDRLKAKIKAMEFIK